MAAVVPKAAARVNVLLPLPGAAMLVGERPAVTPLGSPLTDNATADLNPLNAAVVSVMGAVPPVEAVTVEALGASVKLGAPVTISASGAVRVSPPPVPVTVMV